VSYEPLHHKYRPQTFADLVGQEAITNTLTNAIRSERIAPAYLFTGARGTGKTSSARILAKSLNCQKQDKPTESPCGVCQVCRAIAQGNALDVIEIDAASNTGVDNIREIIERAQFAPVQCRYKVYVIDECHMLSGAAFNALLKTLEEPPARVIFVLATTDPQRVLPTIISRCQRFDFRRIPLDAMVSHLEYIASKENINIAPDAVTLVAQVAQGGLRDAESLLDQLSLLPGEVTVEAVWDLVGAVPEKDLMALAKAIASDDSEAVLEQCRRLMDRGREPLIVLQNLAGFYRDLLIARTAPTRSDLVAITPPTWKQLCEFAQKFEVPSLLQGQQHLKNSEAQIKNTTQPRLWLEVTLLGLLPSANSPQPVELGIRKPESRANPGSTQASSPEGTLSRHQPPLGDSLPPHYQNATQPVSPPTEEQSRQQPTVPAIETPSTRVSPTLSQVPPTQAPEVSPPVHHEAPSTPPAVSQSPEESVEIRSAANAQSTSLEQVWQELLVHVQPPFTQGLLRQHGCLLAFDGSVARVGISSQPLLKIAQGKLSNIEAAFDAVHKSKVKVILQAGAAESSNSAPTEVQPYPNRSEAWHTPAGRTPAENSSGLNPNNAEDSKELPTSQSQLIEQTRQVLSDSVSAAALQELAGASTRPTVPPPTQLETSNSSSMTPVTPPSTSPSAPEVECDADEVEKALGNLKLFFDGEIVELTDYPELAVNTYEWQSQAVINAATNQVEPEPEEEEEQDLIEPPANPPLQFSQRSTLSTAQIAPQLADWQDNDDEIPF
jgi:DNA polymerase-3 subunit gamma/tau